MKRISSLRFFLLMFSLFCIGDALAGVTIHYGGVARNSAAEQAALKVARRIAKENGWTVEEANSPNTDKVRLLNDKKVLYSGPLTGIRINPAPMSEPLYLQFGADYRFQDFIKTQFAGADVHIKVTELLRALEPYIIQFEIHDESEYWSTKNQAALERAIKRNNETIELMKKLRPGARGPEKAKNGRIVDLVMAPER